MPIDEEATNEMRTFYANLADHYRQMSDEQFAKLKVRTPEGRESTAEAEGLSRMDRVREFEKLAKTVTRTYEEDVE